MTKTCMNFILAGGLLMFSIAAQAQLGDYTQSPETNSSDWEAKVTALGGTVNKNVDFESHAIGPLDGTFYAGSDGVTLTAEGDVDEVRFGVGPDNGNTSSTPISDGEGPHPESNYLFDGRDPSSLTISFDSPVWGAGLFTIDHFNPNGSNILTVEAFDGPDGTGSSLGLVTSAAFNYQPDNLYFMGVTSDSGNIRSIVFTDVNSDTGDTIGLDDIWFATSDGVEEAEPVPTIGFAAKFALLVALMLMAGMTLKRRGVNIR